MSYVQRQPLLSLPRSVLLSRPMPPYSGKEEILLVFFVCKDPERAGAGGPGGVYALLTLLRSSVSSLMYLMVYFRVCILVRGCPLWL